MPTSVKFSPIDHEPGDPSDGIWKYMLVGVIAIVVLVGGVGGWAVTTNISGAVIASGVVVVESSVKKVQHPTGGVVGAILVKEGDSVTAGDLLIRLDETVTRANLQIITKQLDELAVRMARLKAERDNENRITFPKAIAARTAEPGLLQIIRGESNLFASRRRAVEGQKEQLRNRIAQLREEILGLQAQENSKSTEIGMITSELDGMRALMVKNLVPKSRVTSMRREVTRIEGERARLAASVAQTKGRIVETNLQMLQIDRQLEADIIKEIREIQAEEAQLIERKIAASDQLKRVDIRAPKSGLVHQLEIHTIGGVIRPSDTLMQIIPKNDRLVVEARIAPEDIANVYLAQKAFIRFSAFNQRTTPELNGMIERVGADLTSDPQTQIGYYLARISLLAGEMEKLGDLKLVPGMPVEIHMRTGDRTAFAYLMQPLRDQMRRAFKQQ